MFKMHPTQISELSNLAIMSDSEIRSDLSVGYIVNENDYTSNFTGAFRRNINTYSKTGLVASSTVLNASDEQRLGCDAAIVITSGGESKVAIFEAKWPRLSKPRYKWDYSQTSTGLSHFSDQLNRQKKCSRVLAIFEIFYCEFPFSQQPTYMHDRVSSCIWHNEAYSFNSSRKYPDKIWTQSDITSMLKIGSLDIGEIVKQICLCKKGAPIKMDNYELIASEFRLPSNILHVKTNE